ncbi:Uncharacterised protein [Escherichia coli]|uniref:Uncharacterized protein n=1 Tax=Escherichia coli TaxID=562 RepID=A0A376SCE0_ECOLX|nr:Uncharacterised protein [Escherichia coli]
MRKRVTCTDVENFTFDALNNRFIIDAVQHVTHPASQFFRFGFFKATTGNRREYPREYRRSQRALRIVRYAVFVDGDVSTAQSGVRFFTGQVFINQINQEQVVISARRKPLCSRVPGTLLPSL